VLTLYTTPIIYVLIDKLHRTTFAALLGAVPLAIAAGPGSELRRPLGIASPLGFIHSGGSPRTAQ
jgi:hypothetical protein